MPPSNPDGLLVEILLESNLRPNWSKSLPWKAINYHSAEETSQVTTAKKDYYFILAIIIVEMLLVCFVFRDTARCLLQKERVSGYEEEWCSGARVFQRVLAWSSSSFLPWSPSSSSSSPSHSPSSGWWPIGRSFIEMVQTKGPGNYSGEKLASLCFLLLEGKIRGLCKLAKKYADGSKSGLWWREIKPRVGLERHGRGNDLLHRGRNLDSNKKLEQFQAKERGEFKQDKPVVLWKKVDGNEIHDKEVRNLEMVHLLCKDYNMFILGLQNPPKWLLTITQVYGDLNR